MQAAGELAAEALGGAGAIVRDVHRGVARRVFGMLGVGAAPVRLAHDGISTLAHASVRAGLRTLPQGSGRALALASPPDAPSLADSPRGSFALGAINGMWGDRIERDHAPLALGLDLRIDGEPAGKLAVFAHGLCETDAAWGLGGGPTYGERLRRSSATRPSTSATTPAATSPRTGARWPPRSRRSSRSKPVVEEIVLVGHSMGGLVARSACHYGERGGHAWTRALRHVVCLGSPHHGAPLERAAAAAAACSAGFRRPPRSRAC